MTTKPNRPRPWPVVAKEQRDRAAEKACHALMEIRHLQQEEPILHQQVLYHVGRTIDDLQDILRLLESAGAQTRP
jgi:hypothetical protein